MQKSMYNPLLIISIVLISMVTGYFIGNDSAEITHLRAKLREAAGNESEKGFGSHEKPQAFRISSSNPRTALTDRSKMSEFAINAGVTAEDVAATRELEKQRKEGKFILKNERPLFKKLQSHDFKMISAATAAENAQEYGNVFSALSLDVKTATELQDHLSKIHQASLEAETSIDQVVDARRKYDDRLRSLLSDEEYAAYEQYEMSKPARSELEYIKKFAIDKNVLIEMSGEEAIVSLLLETGVVYGGMGHGPYGSLPFIPANIGEALSQAERDLERLVASAAEMNRRLTADPTVGETEQRLVAEYLLERVNNKRALVDSLQKSFKRIPIRHSPEL